MIIPGGFAPGFGVWQATQAESSPLLLIMHVSQVHDPAAGANFAAKLLSDAAFVETPNDGVAVVFAVLAAAPGFGDLQATQALSVDLF